MTYFPVAPFKGASFSRSPVRVGRGVHLRHRWTYSDKVLSYSPIAYWPLWETTGLVPHCLVDSAQDGSYIGVNLGFDGIGDDNSCPYFDGVNDYGNCYSVTFRNAFTPSLFTIILWGKLYSGTQWTDGNIHTYMRFEANGNNFVRMYKGANNRNDWVYNANAVTDAVTKSLLTTTGWFFMAMTVSLAADEMKGYYFDALNPFAQVGATQNGLGTWVGTLSPSLTLIGALSTVPVSVLNGYMAHVVVFNRVLTATELQDLT